MHRFTHISFFFLIALAPAFVSAQVVINEVMYNPQGSDTGREWIELYNEGSSDVTIVAGSGKGSWRVGDASNHTLTDPAGGTGRGPLVIPAGGYMVLASDPSEFISGEYAGGSYPVIKSSISLNNTGGTVSLIDGSGTVVDSVSYTKDMGGNDDGTSLQKNSLPGQGSAWISALPTPGAANATSQYVSPSTDTTSDTSSQTTDQTTQTDTTQTTPTSAPVSSYVPPPVPQLFADAGIDRTVIVGADTEFDGRAYNRQKETVDHVRFLWNFGDGSTAEGPAVLHHYVYPGRYALVLTIAENKDAVVDEVIVTAEPAKLAFTVVADGSVAIENHAGRDLDLSGWLVRSFGEMFTLPEHSVILSGETMRIAQPTLKFWSGLQTELEYPNGVVALHANENSIGDDAGAVPAPASVPAAGTPVQPESAPPAVAAVAAPEANPVSDPPVEIATDTASSTTLSESQTASAANSVPGNGNGMYWWLGAAALAALAGGAVFAVRRVKAGEWDIVEET
jgi:hypothetical protein